MTDSQAGSEFSEILRQVLAGLLPACDFSAFIDRLERQS